MTAFVQSHWLDLCAKLGERVAEFIEAGWKNALAYELRESAAAARFVNLCCALGPGFERSPQNEWALAILADERLGPWVKVHQLVIRGASELRRRPHDGAAISGQLLRADALLLDQLEQSPSGAPGAAAGAAREACDLELVDLRVLEIEWRGQYRKVEGRWKFLPLAAPPLALRIGSRESIPREISILTLPAASPLAARLQVRSLKHSLCGQDRHPLLTYAGQGGLRSWHGHAAIATSWPVHCDAAPDTPQGTLKVLLEETMAQPNLLRIATCGLRDEGVPLGGVEMFVFAYPAHQWLFGVHREKGLQLQWPRQGGDEAIPSRTRCRVERDGTQLPSKSWALGFHEGLDAAFGRGLNELFAAWQKAAGDAGMSAAADLLTGTAELSWGWNENAGGLSGHPLTRVAVDFDASNEFACAIAGEVELGLTRTRVRLVCEGVAPMKQQLCREVARGALPEVLLGTQTRWRWPYRIEFDPVAVEGGAMWSELASCTGAIVGECGLRPRVTGGTGWQWYEKLVSEPVSVHVRVHDPVLGQSSQTIQLLPEVKLLDWSLG